MFIPTFPKLLVIALVLFVAWRLFRPSRAQSGDDRTQAQSRSGRKGAAAHPIQDMRPCPKCGAYVTAEFTHCGKEGCPGKR